jgi:hypothetical protein
MMNHPNVSGGARAWRRGIAAALLPLFFFPAGALLHAQSAQVGEIRGKISSLGSGDPIVRATVTLVGTKLGAFSDLKGNYTVRHVPAGRYSVRISYVGFTTKTVSDVDVDGGTTQLDVVLEPTEVKGKEVVVTAKGGNGTEVALLNQRRKSASISDGISAAQIRKSPDATSGEALARVTGLSVVGNKFVYVRGTSERYNNTELNGVPVTSTEPDKRSFSFDLFPSNLLENTIVSKTFTPDLPGDFAGGLVQLNTIDYPDRTTFRASVAGAYADGTTGQSMALGPRGSNDWIGIDDGNRQLPDGIPNTKVNSANFTQDQIVGFSKLFPNDWGTSRLKAPVNKNFALSYGDRFTLFDNDFGVVAGISYRNGYNYYPILRADSNRFHYSGVNNDFSSLWGGVFNLSYKLGDLHSIGVKTTFSQTAEDENTYLEGRDYYTGTDRKLYGLHFTQRGFWNGQVTGEHVIPELLGTRVQWRAYAGSGFRTEPDFRRLQYARYDPTDTTQPFIAVIGSSTPNALGAGRFYSDLNDALGGFGADITVPFDEVKLKVGTVIENKGRDFHARLFGYKLAPQGNGLKSSAIDTLFDESHVDADALTIEETTAPSDKYTAASHLKAFYAMADLPFTLLDQSFRVIGGARVESYRQIINTADVKPINLDSTITDVMPSINLIYQMTPQMNLRMAYSKTVSRPEFREYAKFAFYDFTTDALVYGNPYLRRAQIRNYDIRYEYFPGMGDLLAVSWFHKDFTDAIEEVALAGDSPERTWANAQKARNTGVEFEVRKSFGFIGELLSPVSLSFNYTWLDSRVDVAGSDFTAAKTGRRLQGQSPYTINLGLSYDDPEIGTSVSVLFNRFGERVTQVSRTDQPDYIEEPRSVVDISAAQTLFTNYEVKLTVHDLLAEDQVFTQYGKPARINGKQTSTSLSFTFKF